MSFNPTLNKERFEAAFTVVDSHTLGEFTRIVLSGFPEIEGDTMMERKNFLVNHCDDYRTALMLEPRGHHDMFGAIITEPISPEADLGVIFMDTGGYLNMCGHGTIGTATVAVETGLVPVTEPYTEVVLEAPAGIIRTKVKVENGKAVEVTLTNVPAFLYKDNLTVEVDGVTIPYCISFGGSFFALVDASKLGYNIGPAAVPALQKLGMKMLEKINQEVKVQHPTLDITTVDLVEFYGPTPNPENADMRNVVIFGEAQADRSPCGTGTSAKLATLYAWDEIKVGEEFRYESFTGSVFRGVIKEETTIADYKAVIPQITGSAYITGLGTYVIDPTDPLKYGFSIG